MEPDISAAFERQATGCAALGGQFTARVCRLLGQTLDTSTAFGRRVLDWPRDSLWPDLMPLRCCAALNTLMRQGQADALAAFYPPHDNADDDAFARAITATIAAHDAGMTAFLDSPPQTNEVVRSAVLLGGFLEIARATGLPLALYEMGASAGLNLRFDSYRYDLGHGKSWGAVDAPVALASDWRGAGPDLSTPVQIAARAAVDLRPVDARARADRERMLAYIWPEQTNRIRRIENALDGLARSDIRVEQGDALAWLTTQMAQPARQGVCRVVYHSVFMQYLPFELRRQLRAAIVDIGEKAGGEAPFAWLAMEAAPDRMSCELRLTIWPGGEPRTLGRVDWHGNWAEWA